MSILRQNLEELKPASSTKYLVPDGMHTAKCIAIADLGEVENKHQDNKLQPKVEVIWAIDKKTEDGEHLTIRKPFTLSLHEKATLAVMLKDTNTTITSLDQLLGATCLIATQQEKSQDGQRTFANVKTFMAGTSFEVTGTLRLPKWYGITKEQDAESRYVEVLTDAGVVIATDNEETPLPY
jgi:hypothetical protein